MRSFVPILALVAAASATNMGVMDEAQTCAMKTLLSSSACNTGDAACLCSDSAREAVMGEINAACGAAQSEQTKQLASDACSKQKMRRAYQPSGTSQHSSRASASASASSPVRMNGAQQGASQQACRCAANSPEDPEDDPVSNLSDATDPSGLVGADADADADADSQGVTGTTNGRMHASSVAIPSPSGARHGSIDTPSSAARHGSMATPSSAARHGSMATPSSSVARHGSMATPSPSSHSPAPSGADAFSPFQGAGVQMMPSMSIVVSGVLAGVVGVFAAL
ncbi:hypothetical protein PISL3812_09635 [Talaromyces islandicus]|uniref:CFEM domain-containing protein n=1 Tax=Talaromyces islandicus TaxID=28573 RepID=A0A0U1MA96_TALIS|nr:hypothetical protein PISL3812_09635 [Talaromyces islandicus]